jgi:hypothetical protein
MKLLFDISSPIRVGLYIGNDEDGINWVNFRYENLPMFCFRCGLVGHNEGNCTNVPSPSQAGGEGYINPRGAWLRSKIYGRRLLDNKEKAFKSNPLKSLSGGQFSPIPKGLVDKMAKLNMNKHHQYSSGSKGSANNSSDSSLHANKHIISASIKMIQASGNSQGSQMEEQNNNKRKAINCNTPFSQRKNFLNKIRVFHHKTECHIS